MLVDPRTPPTDTNCGAGAPTPRSIRAFTTRATSTITQFAIDWSMLYPSAVVSGIIGDPLHEARGGYHIGVAWNPAGNYSIIRPDDKAPPGTWPRDCASAVDMTLGLADMKLCHARLVAAWKNRDTDPRAKYINAHNGWNGEGGPGRYDWFAGTISSATDDHRWHVHLEFRRRYVDDPKAAAAVLSILAGETVEDWENTMTPDQFLTLLNDDRVEAKLRTLAGQGVHNQRLGASTETIGQDLQSDDGELARRFDALDQRLAAIEAKLPAAPPPTA